MRCPTCKSEHTPTSATKKLGPFCSSRCQLIDLGQWLSEEYRIPDSNTAVTDEELEELAKAAEASAPPAARPR